jgi:sec-independent protein translocase protein TatB
MFDFSWSELALIAVVALVVIGPKDLPRVMRVVGYWVRQARSVAREFQGSVDQMMREAELDEVKKHFDKATSFDVEHEIRNAIDPGGELEHSLSDPLLTNPLIGQPKPEAETKPETAAIPAPAPSESATLPAAPREETEKPATPGAEPHTGYEPHTG